VPNSPINTRRQLEAWIAAQAAVPGGGNPIGIQVWNDFPASFRGANRTIEYYPFFEPARRYLVDPAGHGGSLQDLVALYEELGRGVPLPTAFKACFGISLASFEAQLLRRDARLPAREGPTRLAWRCTRVSKLVWRPGRRGAARYRSRTRRRPSSRA
jgi:hypothetical protein